MLLHILQHDPAGVGAQAENWLWNQARGVSLVKAPQLTLMCSRAEWCFSNSMGPEHHLCALLSCRFGLNRPGVGPRFSHSNRHPAVLALPAVLGVASLLYR